jgi:uncharacterized protein (DUF2237 family)
VTLTESPNDPGHQNTGPDRLPEPEIEFVPLEAGRWFCTVRYLIVVDAGRGVACSCAAGRNGRRCHHVTAALLVAHTLSDGVTQGDVCVARDTKRLLSQPEPEIEFVPLEAGRWFCTVRYLIVVDAGRGVACSCAAGRNGRRCHHVTALMRRQREGLA